MQNPRDWPCCIRVPETGGRFSRNRVATVNTLWISRRNRWKPVDHSPALASPISMIGEVGLPELHRQLTTGNWQLATVFHYFSNFISTVTCRSEEHTSELQ